MINMHPQTISFTGKSRLAKDVANIEKVFKKTFPNLSSPSKFDIFYSEQEKLKHATKIKEFSNRLSFIRGYIQSLYSDGGIPEYFRGLIGIVKVFGVANCDEYAEILKTIFKLNGVKKVDMFSLYAIDEFKRSKPRALDHMVTALGVSKNKNQKQSGKIFIPSNHTKIIDFWLDGKVRNYKDAKQCYKILGLKDHEKLAFKPVKSYEPDVGAFNAILKDFPSLKVKINSKTRLYK